MHDNEKKAEISRLARLMAARLQTDNRYTEHRFKELGVAVNDGAIMVRLHLADWDEIVYQTVRDYQAESRSLNREMEQMGIGMQGRGKIYRESNWRPEHADETLSLLQQATILDQLADL